MSRIAFGLAVGLAFGAASVEGQDSAQCYDTALGAWEPVPGEVGFEREQPDQAEDSLHYEFPSRIRFPSDLYAVGDSALYFEIPDNVLQIPHSRLVWRFRGDTLNLVTSDGFVGLRINLLEDGDRWSGSARTFSDNLGGRLYDRSITITPSDCESPPPVPASGPEYPNSLEFSSGLRLDIGEPVPDEVGLEGGGWIELSPDELVGFYGPADRVRVTVHRTGALGRLDIRYDDPATTARILADMRRLFGPPTLDRENGGTWISRTMWVSIDQPNRILVYDQRLWR